jgi:hypothetical protein
MGRTYNTPGGKRNDYRVFVAKPERDQHEYIDVNRRSILRWILEK